MSNDSIRQLKAVWDIVGEIQKHVALTKKGQNYVGLCPFHNEKTPSFYVSPAKRFFIVLVVEKMAMLFRL